MALGSVNGLHVPAFSWNIVGQELRNTLRRPKLSHYLYFRLRGPSKAAHLHTAFKMGDGMNLTPRKHFLWAALAVAAAAASCDYNGEFTGGPVQTGSRTVKLGDAKSVQVELKMGAGDLKLAGGAKELLDADFSYAVPRWKPEVEYSVRGGRGTLVIRQPEGTGGPRGSGHYTWDLHLNNKVPMELRVDLGAGKSDLSLGTLSLSNLEVNMGVGETVVDLTGDWKNDFQAKIHGGVGQATVRLPRDVGVHVRARGGIGEIHAGELKKDGDIYTNDAYGKSPVTLEVEVEGGIGEINLEFGGPPPVV